MSKLLLDSNPLVIIPELAVEIGLNESIILQQLHYWLQKSTHNYDGRAWVYNSISRWTEQFPFWSQPTIERMMASLKNRRLLLTANYNKMKSDRTLWYSIDYEQLEAIKELKSKNKELKIKKTTQKTTQSPMNSHAINLMVCNHQIDGMTPSFCGDGYHQIDGMTPSFCGDDTINLREPIPEITTETTTKTNPEIISTEITPERREIQSVCLVRQSVLPKTEKKKIEQQSNNPIHCEVTEENIKTQIGYTALLQQYASDIVNEIVLSLLDMYYSPYITIKGTKKPQAIIHSVLARLTHWHITYTIDKFNEIITPIKNKKEYLQSMIYNAVLEMSYDYKNQMRSTQQ